MAEKEKGLLELVPFKPAELAERAFWDIWIELGVLGKVLIAAATIFSLFAHFFPNTNGTFVYWSEKLLDMDSSFKEQNHLAFFGLLSGLLAMVVVLVKKLWQIFYSSLILIRTSISRFGGRITPVFKLIGINFPRINLWLNIERYKQKYTQESWVAGPSRYRQVVDLPVTINNSLHSISFFAQVMVIQNNHWRAGIIFVSEDTSQYIFHIHEDKSDPLSLKGRMVLIAGGKEIRDRNFTFTNSKARAKNRLEIERIAKNKLRFTVNGESMGDFEVPLDKIVKAQVASWADGEIYKIRFKEIEVLAES